MALWPPGNFFAFLKSRRFARPLPEMHADMKPVRLFALLILLSATRAAHGQMERTIYQVFDVDSVKTVHLDIADIYDIFSWAGSTILVETNVQLSHGSPEILDYLIKEGRYDLAMDTIAMPEVKIYTKMPDRKKKRVKTPDGEITEIPAAKIFVPDTFTWSDDKKLLWRKEK